MGSIVSKLFLDFWIFLYLQGPLLITLLSLSVGSAHRFSRYTGLGPGSRESQQQHMRCSIDLSSGDDEEDRDSDIVELSTGAQRTNPCHSYSVWPRSISFHVVTLIVASYFSLSIHGLSANRQNSNMGVVEQQNMTPGGFVL